MTSQVPAKVPLHLDDLRQAERLIRGVVYHTTLNRNEVFSRECGAEIYLKLENLQRTGSFKIRGASHKIARLLEKANQQQLPRPSGVIAVSAGNHAQGVASAAAYNGLPATVVMPLGASMTKMRACREMGAEVLQVGASLEEAATYAQEVAAERGYIFLHPYDDWDIIAGQASVGLEMLRDLPDLTLVVVPLGGGGLLSGVALALKLQNPAIRVIGVQTETVSPYLGFIQTGQYHPVQPGANTIADGIKVKTPGQLTSLVLRHYVDDVVTVDDNHISEAIVTLLERTRTMSEGAGAVALAALLQRRIELRPTDKVGVIISGGNIDTTLVGRILDFGLVSSGRYVAVALTVPDTPGQLARILNLVAQMGMNIRQVEHRRAELHIPVGFTEVILQIESKDWEQQEALIRRFADEALHARTLTT
jgi:threonine dehydratase